MSRVRPTRHSSAWPGPRRPAAGRLSRVASVLALSLGLGSGGALLTVNLVRASTDCATTTVLRVTAAPNVASALDGLVADYDRAGHVAGGSCVRIALTSQDTSTTFDRVVAGWPSSAGQLPDVWIPDSTAWPAAARTVAAAERILPPAGTIIASSPVVIASPTPVARALAAAGTSLTWADLPHLAGEATFWREHGHPEWGPFTLAYPVPAASVATAQALTVTAAAAAGVTPAALTPARLAADPAASAAIAALEKASARVEPSTEALLEGLRSAPPVSSDAVTTTISPYFDAAPMLEADVVAYNQGREGHGTTAGPAAGARVPSASAGGWPGGSAAAGGASSGGSPTTTGRTTTSTSATATSATASSAMASSATATSTAAPATTLTAVYPADGVYLHSVPYLLLPLAAGEPKKAAAAANVLSELTGAHGRAAFAQGGFRAPDGSAGARFPTGAASTTSTTGTSGTSASARMPAAATASPAGAGPAGAPGPTRPGLADGAQLEAVRRLFDSLHPRAAVLLDIDTAESTAQLVPGSSPPSSRLAFVARALAPALSLLADDDEIQVWTFPAPGVADGPNAPSEHRELAPMQPVQTPDTAYGTHRQELAALAAGLSPGGAAPLYQPMLDAFRQLNANFQVGYTNVVLVVTDGRAAEATPARDLGVAKLIAALHDEFNPEQPVRIVTIAYGPGVDMTPLDQIAAATGGRALYTPDPADIPAVLDDAIAAVR